MNHVWGLFAHPNQEMSVIKSENETVSHHYTHHVLVMAAVPVICAFIGTTQLGWNFGDGTVIKLSLMTGLVLAVLFYAVMLAGGGGDGAGDLVDGQKLSAAAVAETLYGLCRLRRDAAIFKRDRGALSAGMAVRADRHHRAVLHRFICCIWVFRPS
ncbi:inner membrane protein YohC (plasmid) [Klebsiella aerogenes]|nr:inner membrane protein YohC [Klebsiella aerogenes]